MPEVNPGVPDPELVAFYESYLERCNAHAFDEIGRFVADDVVVNDEPVGLAGYVDGLRAVVAAHADYHWQIRHLVTQGSWLCAHLHDTGTHTGERQGRRATGALVDTTEVALYHVIDGRIAEVWVAADDTRVLHQIDAAE